MWGPTLQDSNQNYILYIEQDIQQYWPKLMQFIFPIHGASDDTAGRW